MTSELDASSEDDFDLEYSETESASPVDHDQVALSKLYWLGKLYFRSALARQVLGNPLPEATEVTVVDLDVRNKSTNFTSGYLLSVYRCN